MSWESTALYLLGTRFTMEQPFYADRLRSHGLDVLVPEGVDRALVHDVIYDEIPVPVFATTALHARAAVDFSLA